MRIALSLIRICLSAAYAVMKLLPVKNKVTFISRQGNTPSNDFNLLQEELRNRHPELEQVVLCRKLERGITSAIGYSFHMLRQLYHLATSQLILLDSYCIAASLLHHKPSLKIVQIWHSMGSMKKFGYSAVGTAEGSSETVARGMHMHENYDYVLCASEKYRLHLAMGFGCSPEIIRVLPLPRLDLLVNCPEYELSVKKRIKDKLPNLQEKPIILYTPTFRKNEEKFEEAVLALVRAIDTEKFNLVVKLHPLSKTDLPDYVCTADSFSSFEMLFVADYVISDYSCIVYEAAVRGIPLFFYDYDIDLYETRRGLAIDYPNELPGIVSKNPRMIADGILTADKNGTYDKVALMNFAHDYITPTNHATSDIIDFLETLL